MRRWRVHNAVLAVVIAAGVAVTATGYALGGRSSGSPAVAAPPSPSGVPSLPGVPTVTPARPTLATPCTLLTGGDFAAVDVPSPELVPNYGPHRRTPLPGQITCVGADATSYTVIWSTSTPYVKAVFDSSRARELKTHWILQTIPVAGADEAYWVQRDDLIIVPLIPDQEAIVSARVGYYSFSLAIPRSTPDAGSKLQALAALLIARLGAFGLSTRWLT